MKRTHRPNPTLGRVKAVCFAILGLLLLGFSASSQINWALHQPVESSGPNWGSFKPGALTDGDPSTFTHPEASTGTLGFTYEVDLGANRGLDRIVLRNRDDGCCPERLSRVRVEVWSDDGGQPGEKRWEALLRADGSNSGAAGVDRLTANLDPDGVFAGRFVRVVNASGAPYNPQLAEIEVYGGALPVIQSFTASKDLILNGETTDLQWIVENATSLTLLPSNLLLTDLRGRTSVSPRSSTTYALVASNANGTARATFRVGVDVRLTPPDLTEFAAENSGDPKDEDGDSSDWIEIANPNEYRLSLDGYYLSDDPAGVSRWRLPNVEIPPGERVIVFASGKNRSNPRGPLHTNFRLREEGDVVALLDRDGVTVLRRFPGLGSGVDRFPPQRNGVSYGVGSSGREGFMRPPTPGTVNGDAHAGVVEDTKFSHNRGLYDVPFAVTVTSDTSGAVIRYTTDRSTPSPTHGQIYASPIPITGTTVLRAAAFRPDWAPTDVDTQTYLFPSNVVQSTVMRRSITTHAVYGPQLTAALRDLPSVSLVANTTIQDTTEVEASLEWIPSNRDLATGLFERSGIRAGCGVRLFGGAFTDFAKKNFRLYFREKYGAGRFRAPLFAGFDRGWPAVESFDQLELRSGSHDMAMRGFYLSNAFTDDTLLEMGHLNPHGRFVHLYLNGTYWGLYHLRERWGASMHQSYRGGRDSDYESINGNWNVGGWAEPGVPYDGDGTLWLHAKSLRADYPALRDGVDVAQYVDFMLMWMFGGAEDEYRCVGSRIPGVGFQFYLNDADGWFCIPQYCAAGNRTGRGAPGRQSGDGPGSFFSMLFASANSDYRSLLADRVQRALTRAGALTPERNQARLDRRSAEIERPFLAESARWGYLTPTEWASRRDSARNTWLPQRSTEVISQFRAAGWLPALAAPTLSQPEGVVPQGFELRFAQPSSGTIHFTLDGTDPRLPGGLPALGSQTLPSSGSAGAQNPVLIPEGARWRWFTDATGLGASMIVPGHAQWNARHWKHPDFDDSSWREGPAQLGYGEGDETTVIPFGSATAKWITGYFRHKVHIPSLTGIARSTLRLKCDDGAIVYLNGQEVLRHAMPTGNVEATTTANASPDDGQGFTAFTLPTASLHPGTNTVAVELHQSSATTSDASFDLEWVLESTTSPGPVAWRLDRNTLVKARVRNGNQWSPLTEAFYQVGADAVVPGDVVIREIHYHPAGTNDVEFLEVENVSNRAVDLHGARFSEGVRFQFDRVRGSILAPGARCLLVQDLLRFRSAHSSEIEVAGVFSGNLANAGESLRLIREDGTQLVAVPYSNATPWSGAAGGAGHSLVLAHPELGLANPIAWRPSSRPGGTPGGSDSRRFEGDSGPAIDLDQDGFPAFVEYALGTSDADPISGRNAIRPGFDIQGRFQVQILRETAADDAQLRVEASDDIVHWIDAHFQSREPDPSGRMLETWLIPPSEGTSHFLRVKVSRSP